MQCLGSAWGDHWPAATVYNPAGFLMFFNTMRATAHIDLCRYADSSVLPAFVCCAYDPVAKSARLHRFNHAIAMKSRNRGTETPLAAHLSAESIYIAR